MYHFDFDFETEIAGRTVGLRGHLRNGAVYVTEVRAPRFVAGVGWVDAEDPLTPGALASYLAAHCEAIERAVHDHAQAEGEARSEARQSR